MRTNDIGAVTDKGIALCASCACPDGKELRDAHRTGEPSRHITHPAPEGIYLRSETSDLYDTPCAICGWAIRR